MMKYISMCIKLMVAFALFFVLLLRFIVRIIFCAMLLSLNHLTTWHLIITAIKMNVHSL